MNLYRVTAALILCLASVSPTLQAAPFSVSEIITARAARPAAEKISPTVYFLLDEKAVFGYGHAALLVGDRDGWDYFSFSPNDQKNNLVHLHFETLAAARAAAELQRYHKFLLWTTEDESRTAIVRGRVLSEWDNSRYDLFERNCMSMVGDALQAGCFEIDVATPIPIVAFKTNTAAASGMGTWPQP